MGVTPYRNGERLKAFYWYQLRLKEGEQPGLYSTNQVELEPSYKVEPGPLGLRFYTFNKAAHAFVVDVAGVEARKP